MMKEECEKCGRKGWYRHWAQDSSEPFRWGRGADDYCECPRGRKLRMWDSRGMGLRKELE